MGHKLQNVGKLLWSPPLPQGGSEWIISVGDVDNIFTVLESSDPTEVRLEL